MTTLRSMIAFNDCCAEACCPEACCDSTGCC